MSRALSAAEISVSVIASAGSRARPTRHGIIPMTAGTTLMGSTPQMRADARHLRQRLVDGLLGDLALAGQRSFGDRTVELRPRHRSFLGAGQCQQFEKTEIEGVEFVRRSG